MDESTVKGRRQWGWMVPLIFLLPLLMAHHPGFPAPLDFVPLEEQGGEDWVLVTTPGFVSAAEPTELVCKEAFGVTGQLYAAVLGTHHYAMDTGNGLAVSFDGCNVDRFHPIDGWLVDLAARGDSRLAFVSEEPEGDRIQWSLDGGDTIAGSTLIDENLNITAIQWFDDERIVATAYHQEDFSDRGAGHLLKLDVRTEDIEVMSMSEKVRFPYLLATSDEKIASASRVDQHIEVVWGPLEDPDRHGVEVDVWPLRADFADDETLLVVLFTVYAEWTGVALATEEGLQTDPRLADRDARCVVADGDGLWLCSSGFAEAYELWRIDGADEAKPFYRLAYLEGPRTDCPQDSDVAQRCPKAWESIKDEIPQRSLDGEKIPPNEGGEDSGERPNEEEQSSANGGGNNDLPDWFDDAVDGSDDEETEAATSEHNRGCRHSNGFSVESLAVLLLLVLICFARLVAAKQPGAEDSRGHGGV